MCLYIKVQTMIRIWTWCTTSHVFHHRFILSVKTQIHPNGVCVSLHPCATHTRWYTQKHKTTDPTHKSIHCLSSCLCMCISEYVDIHPHILSLSLIYGYIYIYIHYRNNTHLVKLVRSLCLDLVMVTMSHWLNLRLWFTLDSFNNKTVILSPCSDLYVQSTVSELLQAFCVFCFHFTDVQFDDQQR